MAKRKVRRKRVGEKESGRKAPRLGIGKRNTQINEEILQSLAEELQDFRETPWTGLSARRIREMGFYEELGLRLELQDLPLGQYYAGLAALARDMDEYLAKHPRDDAALFKTVISLINTEERPRYGGGAFPTLDGQRVEILPTGLASAADSGRPTVELLGNPAIVHEWMCKPGKKLLDRFLQKFGRKLKETICGKDSPYEQFNKGLLGQADLPKTIAASILAVGFSPATFWYPLAVYLGILLVKTGLKTYCEP